MFDIGQAEALAIHAFGAPAPGTGCTFISPDGTFVNIYPKLDTHEDLCDWVEDQLGIELEYKDEEFFVREFNWVRLRSDPNMSIIMLPKDSLFRNQWYSLEDWLTYLEGKYSNGCKLYLETCDGTDTDVEYNFGTEYFAEDIIKICKRYYSSGKLYMSTEVDKMKKQVTAKLNFDFFDWYNNKLTNKQQRDVDDTANELGFPEYDECSDNQLSKIFYRWAKTRYNSNEPRHQYIKRELVEASSDYEAPSDSEGDWLTDTYVVKIWHETDPGHDTMGPEAAEEVFEVVATSPQDALEKVKRQWTGHIDAIRIVDVNPEPDEYSNMYPFTASTAIPTNKHREDKLREAWYTTENYPEVTDASKFEDFKRIDWCDLTAEDCETFLVGDYDLSSINSVRYFDDDEQDWAEANGYDGGYVINDTQDLAWHFGSDDFVDVTDKITYAIGNKPYRDATKENDFAVITEDYNRAIANEAYKNLNSATQTINTSAYSFDFIHDDDYDAKAIEDAIVDVLVAEGVTPLGGSFESVDYSDYPEYRDALISQCNYDFEWTDDYDEYAIDNGVVAALDALGYKVIGSDFYSIGE